MTPVLLTHGKKQIQGVINPAVSSINKGGHMYIYTYVRMYSRLFLNEGFRLSECDGALKLENFLKKTGALISYFLYSQHDLPCLEMVMEYGVFHVATF